MVAVPASPALCCETGLVTADPSTDRSSTDYGKSTADFRMLGTSLEPRSPDLGTVRTPIERFFVCTVGDAMDINSNDWSMRIDGDAVHSPVVVNLEELRALPQVTQTTWLECAGNGRTLYSLVGGQRAAVGAEHTQWVLNGMGIAEWSGPTLASVLALAGLSTGAEYVSPVGLDADNPEGEPVRMCLPVTKGLRPDTLVALDMNGAPLPRSHGAPARLLVPGWVGAYSVKWLGEITVSSSWVPSWRADDYYRERTPDGVIGEPVTAHPVKSTLALPFPAQLAEGHHELQGYARSGSGPITRVEWSLDGGPWEDADLDSTAGPWAWTVFRVSVNLSAERHVIRTRATDKVGNTQPERHDHHPYGVLWRAVVPHPIEVTGR